VDDFEVDQSKGAAKCPGGFTVPLSPKGRADFTAHCGRCVLRDRCTKAKKGRVVTLDDAHLRRKAHRARARDPQFKASYRKVRPMAERAVEWMTRRRRRVPYRGIAKNNACWRATAAAVNLQRLVALGLTRNAGAWTLRPAPTA
jgi:hypothetical protein